MKSLFVQAAEHNMKTHLYSDHLKKLPDVIRKHAGWDYAYTQTDTGCFMHPTFHNMPYRNAFVPEVDIIVSNNDVQTILHITGRPVKSVRIFMACWFGILLIIELFLLVLAISSKLDSLYSVFIPAVMCVLGYFLCTIATKIAFNTIVKAIQIADLLVK